MSIVTKGGDAGQTSLLYERRVSKCHPRVEACGCVDELNAALGLVRALIGSSSLSQRIERIQKDLFPLMGELATLPEDLTRFGQSGHRTVTAAWTARLDAWIAELEAQKVSFRGWAIPGATPAAAALDVARTVCRRAERRVCAVCEAEPQTNREILIYLNRLSDLLWLLARQVEGQEGR